MLAPENPGSARDASVHAAAARGIGGSGGKLPYGEQIQRSFGGYDLSNVQVHADASAMAATAAMGADAYASGNHVVLGAGGKDLHTVAHEAAHVVQQRSGVSLSGGIGQAGDPYERHADAVADLVVQGQSAEGLLGAMAGGSGSQKSFGVENTGPVQMKALLTPEIALEEGEAQLFATEVAPLGIAPKTASKLFARARKSFLSGDPRMHTLAGTALGVDGTWPTWELIAAVCREQARRMGEPGQARSVSGYPTPQALEVWLAESPHAKLVEDNKDLFKPIAGRSATEGQKTENRAHRAEFNKHAKHKACLHDTKACAASLECQKLGACVSNGGVCSYGGAADCAVTERCAIYGGCASIYRNCPDDEYNCMRLGCGPTSDAHCATSRICREYGACKFNRYRCSRNSETKTCATRSIRPQSISASTTQVGYGDLSLAAENLIDDRYQTAWAPDPATPFPHQIKLVLPSRTRVAGVRMAPGSHRIDWKEGILVEAFGIPLGIAIKADGAVQDVFLQARGVEWRSLRIDPIEASVVELEIFDAFPGWRFDHYAITELEVLVCDEPEP